MNAVAVGKRCEDLAVDFLFNQGYKILYRNYRSPFGEIDIIAEDQSSIVFVEVKARATLNYGYPEESVNHQKQKKIIQTAEAFLLEHDTLSDRVFRFDVISIYKGKIKHIISAFF